MKFVLATILVFSSINLFAKTKAAHKHHKAHVHGAATLNLAFDGVSGRIEFKAAADGVVGFEHEANSEKDKVKLAEVISKFESRLSQMVIFDQLLECVISIDKTSLVLESKAEKKAHAQHADFVSHANVVCKKSPLGTKITFDFTAFKALKDIDATILIGDLQKSVEIKNKPLMLELK